MSFVKMELSSSSCTLKVGKLPSFLTHFHHFFTLKIPLLEVVFSPLILSPFPHFSPLNPFLFSLFPPFQPEKILFLFPRCGFLPFLAPFFCVFPPILSSQHPHFPHFPLQENLNPQSSPIPSCTFGNRPFLHRFLWFFFSQVGSSKLTFEQRLQIAIGMAEGIRYMHIFANPSAIHRDIKTDNILLDENWTVQFSPNSSPKNATFFGGEMRISPFSASG